MKAVLVFDESFRSAKKQMKAYPAFRPTLDLPELVSSMIDMRRIVTGPSGRLGGFTAMGRQGNETIW